MCGIVGYYHFAADKVELEKIVRKMTQMLFHRGPDDEGIYTSRNLALGHRRLSIIDLAQGSQPMSNRDETVWIVFNGEIYNFLELRKTLEKTGYHFRTRSDTEVLIALYEKHGPDMLQKINGMFAFAIWDLKKHRLFLARDRIGKKPLFHYYDSERFIFASELKAILVDPQVPRRVAPESVEMYFTFGYVPAPYTILKDVHKLLPGHYMIVTPEQIQTKKYWDINYSPIDKNEEKNCYMEQLRDLLYYAVKRRLISDVPLGAFLSGGIDSSAVVSMMSQINGSAIKTFTIGFDEAAYSETEDARLVATHFNTIHQERTVHASSFNILQDIVWHFDEPFGDSSAIPTYFVSQMAREFVTVALSGDGGDELFAGYNYYHNRQLVDKYRKIPSWFNRFVLSPLAHSLPLQAPGKNFLMDISQGKNDFGLGLYPYIKDIIYSTDLKEELKDFSPTFDLFPQVAEMNAVHPLSKRQYLDIKFYLPNDILVKVDKMSMAHSLEIRAPLLDYTIVEFSTKLPPEWQMQNGEGKIFFKDMLKPFLPEQVFTKKKQGFSIPKKNWFKNAWCNAAYDILLSPRAQQRGYFDSRVVNKILDLHRTGRRDYSNWIWCWINFELWHQTFLDSDLRRV